MQVCNAVGVLCGYNPLPLATLLTSTRCAASMHLNWALHSAASFSSLCCTSLQCQFTVPSFHSTAPPPLPLIPLPPLQCEITVPRCHRGEPTERRKGAGKSVGMEGGGRGEARDRNMPLIPHSSPFPPLKDGARLSGPERDRMRVAVLDEASIVCSTLSFAGSQMFYRMTRKVRGGGRGSGGGPGEGEA